MKKEPVKNLEKAHLPMDVLVSKIVEELRAEKNKEALKSRQYKHLKVIK